MTPRNYVKRLYWSVATGFVAIAVLMAAVADRFEFTINKSHSLDGTLYVIHKGAPIERGNLVAYRWHGGGPYPAGVTFIKVARGMPGDVVSRIGQNFWINGTHIGAAKTHGRDGKPLEASSAGVIDAGEVFVATASVDSLDSRYAMSGNIAQRDIVGRAYVVF